MRLYLNIRFSLAIKKHISFDYQVAVGRFVYRVLQMSKYHDDKMSKLHCSAAYLNTKSVRIHGQNILQLTHPNAVLIISGTTDIIKRFMLNMQKNFYYHLESCIFQIVDHKLDDIFISDFSDTVMFETHSPICISINRENNSAEYLHPLHKDYKQNFYWNLSNKSGVKDENFRLFIDEKTIKKKLKVVKTVNQKPIKLVGYQYKFFMHTKPELMYAGYVHGFGHSTANGFGFTNIIKQ